MTRPTAAELYNRRMEKIWEEARALERERVAQGLPPNSNLTDPASVRPLRTELTPIGEQNWPIVSWETAKPYPDSE